MTFTFSPFAVSRVVKVRRNVCQETRLWMPSFRSGGGMRYRMTFDSHSGCLPRFLPARALSVAKTQSVGSREGVRRYQARRSLAV